MSNASFIVFIQHTLLQYGLPFFLEREPIHWMNATVFGICMSLGRTRRPPVGPPAFINRSNSNEVIVLGNLRYPYSVKATGSYTSMPVATMIVPTSSSTSSGLSLKFMASGPQTSLHRAQVFSPRPMQLFSSIR